MSSTTYNDTRQKANIALLEVEKGNLIILQNRVAHVQQCLMSRSQVVERRRAVGGHRTVAITN